MNYSDYLAYFISQEERPSFRLLEGQGQVLISAPHSVEQTRKGKIKYGEYQTGILAGLLHDKLDCPIIVKTHNCHDDANFDEQSPYKESLCQYVIDNGIKYVIDLHQLAPQRTENIDLGTGHGKNIKVAPFLSYVVKTHFESRGIEKITIDKLFDASYPFTVSSFIANKCNIACIQIEINSRLVCDKYEDFCFFTLLEVLEQIVIDLNER